MEMGGCRNGKYAKISSTVQDVEMAVKVIISWKVEDHKYRVGDLTTSGRNTGTVHDVPRKDQ